MRPGEESWKGSKSTQIRQSVAGAPARRTVQRRRRVRDPAGFPQLARVCALRSLGNTQGRTFVTKLGCYHRCMPSLRLLVASLVLSSIVWAGTARAEAPPPEIVGRVAATPGGVSLRPAGGEWGDSARNDPVASGMSLRTSTGGRATLGIGARIVTLSGGSELDIARLDDAG